MTQSWDPNLGNLNARSGPMNVDSNLTINQSDAVAYDGKTLVFTSAFVVTLSVDLPLGFGFAAIPPASGNASIASDGTVLLNGATTTLTRAAAANTIFAVVKKAKDSYVVTGS